MSRAKHVLSKSKGRNGANNKNFEARKRPRGPKFEIRNNSKMIKNSKFQTNSIRIRCFGFSEFEIYLAPVCFGPRGFFRASDFGFEFDGFVSVRGAAFDIRISDFVTMSSWRDKFC